jgi:hypothetical protein
MTQLTNAQDRFPRLTWPTSHLTCWPVLSRPPPVLALRTVAGGLADADLVQQEARALRQGWRRLARGIEA